MSALIGFAGALALLIWATAAMQLALDTAFAARLRRAGLSLSLGRAKAFAAGLVTATLLQSSTAIGLMATAMAANGLLQLSTGLGALLGANIGTTLAVQLLAHAPVVVSPLLLCVGVAAALRGDGRVRALGQGTVAIGILMVALDQLGDYVGAAAGTPLFRLLSSPLAGEPLLALLLGAGVAWAAHSSIAVVLLAMALAGSPAFAPEAAMAVMLGANVGTSFNPLLEGSARSSAAGRRLALGNLLIRAAGALACLPFLGALAALAVQLIPAPAQQVAVGHMLFNIALALLFLPMAGLIARLLRAALPDRPDAGRSDSAHFLREGNRPPAMRLADATREALRLLDMLEAELERLAESLCASASVYDRRDRPEAIATVAGLLKAHLLALEPADLDAEHRIRRTQLVAFAAHIELVPTVLGTVSRALDASIPVANPATAEFERLIDQIRENLRCCAPMLLNRDPAEARRLVESKKDIRALVAEVLAHPWGRMAHLDGQVPLELGRSNATVANGLKQLNSHIVEAVCYPVLDEARALLPTRLKPHADGVAA